MYSKKMLGSRRRAISRKSETEAAFMDTSFPYAPFLELRAL
jgi:hypothetical protein